jgi:hypothetical protein
MDQVLSCAIKTVPAQNSSYENGQEDAGRNLTLQKIKHPPSYLFITKIIR